jgi:hypothetical protein
VTTVDLAFFHDVLHHVDKRGRVPENTGEIHHVWRPHLRRGFRGGKGPHIQQPELQVSREQLAGWMKDAGFTQVADAKLFDDKFVLTFARK